MSSFYCEHCRTLIKDLPDGSATSCEHYPPEVPVEVYVQIREDEQQLDDLLDWDDV